MIPLSKKAIGKYLDDEIRKWEKFSVVNGDFHAMSRVYALEDVRFELTGSRYVRKHDGLINARKLRMTTVREWMRRNILSVDDARSMLAACLQKGDVSTFVDDSALLDDPDVFEKLEAGL